MTTNLKTHAVLPFLIFSTLTAQAVDAGAAPGTATEVPLRSAFRLCDFSQVAGTPLLPRLGFGSGVASIRPTGATVVAQVHFSNTSQPGGHYDVILIQLPRPSSSTCGPGDAGTDSSTLDLDAGGQGTLALQGHLRSGATGVWISVSQPNPRSQGPAEFYNSEFVVPA